MQENEHASAKDRLHAGLTSRRDFEEQARAAGVFRFTLRRPDGIAETKAALPDPVRHTGEQWFVDAEGMYYVSKGLAWEGPFTRLRGNVAWEDEVHNLVVNEGLDHLLDCTLAGGTQITSWFLGLTDGTPTPAAGDTMSSHAGWTEVTDYDEANRPACTFGSVSSQSVDNSGSVASYSINASVTIGGAFLTSDNTKGGSTGTLYSVGAFSGGDKSAGNGDTLEVTYTATMAAA